MRINLEATYAEKEAVKALGARWDSVRKNLYITDVEDLTPFLRWIPNSGKCIATATDGDTRKPTTSQKGAIKQQN